MDSGPPKTFWTTPQVPDNNQATQRYRPGPFGPLGSVGSVGHVKCGVNCNCNSKIRQLLVGHWAEDHPDACMACSAQCMVPHMFRVLYELMAQHKVHAIVEPPPYPPTTETETESVVEEPPSWPCL